MEVIHSFSINIPYYLVTSFLLFFNFLLPLFVLHVFSSFNIRAYFMSPPLFFLKLAPSPLPTYTDLLPPPPAMATSFSSPNGLKFV